MEREAPVDSLETFRRVLKSFGILDDEIISELYRELYAGFSFRQTPSH